MTGAHASIPAEAAAAASTGVTAASLAGAVTIATETPTQRYIRHVYGSLFGRVPDAAGWAFWTTKLTTGTPRVQVANSITSSSEYRTTLIRAAYVHYLGRQPDTTGLNGWLAAMRAGMTISRIESGFVASPEYYAKAGGTDAGWVTKLYKDVLGRTAGANEVTYWSQQLRGGVSRGKVAANFLLSTEHLTTVMNARYVHLIGRNGSDAELRKWILFLKTGGRDEVAIGAIIASTEYFNKADVAHRLTLTPSSGTIVSGGSLIVAAQGFDEFNYDLGDLTTATSFTVSGAPCVGATCSPTDVGDQIVTGTVGIATGHVTMHVNAAGAAGFTTYSWGLNTYGELGLGSVIGRDTPAQVGLDTHWASISAGGAHAVGIKTDGTLWAWGRNESGELGDGTRTDRTIAIQVGTDTDWATVAAGSFQTFALKTDGELWSWGANEAGQLGDGSVTDRLAPTPIGTDAWVSVASRYNHSVGIKSDGTAWAWGNNDRGALGDGTTVERHSPVQVGTDTNWATASAANMSTVAVKTDHTLWAWGDNQTGQLGDGTTDERHTPAQVGTDTTWASASAGAFNIEALKTDGTLWAWGWNVAGQLGIGGNVTIELPFQVRPGTHWTSVTTGYVHTVGVKSDGTLWAWGSNDAGQLGTGGGLTHQSLPVQVGTDTNWARAAADDAFTIALKN